MGTAVKKIQNKQFSYRQFMQECEQFIQQCLSASLQPLQQKYPKLTNKMPYKKNLRNKRKSKK